MKRPSRRFAMLRKLAPLAIALPLMAASADDCTIAIRLEEGEGESDDVLDDDDLTPDGDADRDGLSNAEELERGLDPLNPDTDGDGILDSVDDFDGGEDPGIGLPCNADFDCGAGLVCVEGACLYVDGVDSDGDGLSDFDEVYNFGTDPLNPDSNGDGVNDSNDPSSQADSDNDGLTDFVEGHFGTDPQNADTDGDGLPDGDEVYIHGTDPLTPDRPRDENH